MANNFPITITAVDNATAAIKKVNESFARLTAPIKDLGTSVKSFTKESGIDDIGKSILNVGRSAGDTAEKIASMVTPLLAIAGIGSLAGIAALGTKWAETGADIGRAAQTIGISTTTLQELTGAATAFGITTDATTSSLVAFGGALQDSVTGRNYPAANMLIKLGIRLRHTKSGAIDAAAALGDLADAIVRQPTPQTQAKVAGMFGVSAMLPFLRQSRAGIEMYERMALASGAVMTPAQIVNATKFSQQLAFAKLSVQGLGNSILSSLVPSLEPMLAQFTKWVMANRQLIATNVTSFVRAFTDTIKQVDWKEVGKDIADFARGINNVVQALGGWKTVAEGIIIALGVKWAVGLFGPLLKLGWIASGTTLKLLSMDAALGEAGLAGTLGLITSRLLLLGVAAAAIYAIVNPPRGTYDKGHKGDVAHWHPNWLSDKKGQIDKGNVLNQNVLDILFPNRTWWKTPAPAEQEPGGAMPGASGTTANARNRAAAWQAALAEQTKWGIPAKVTYAQWAEESNYGANAPAGSNNPFGIKALPGQPYVAARTQEFVNGQMQTVMAHFAKFSSLGDAFDAHARLLATSTRYADARKHENDAGAFADALTGVYATDPNYGTKLRNIMRMAPPMAPPMAGPYSPGAGTISGPILPPMAAAPVGKIEVHFKGDVPRGTRVSMTDVRGVDLSTHVAYPLPGQTV